MASTPQYRRIAPSCLNIPFLSSPRQSPPRKPGLKPSLWDGIIPLGESRGGTPTGVRAPLSARRAQARRLDLRLSAFCLPFFSREEKSKWRVVDSEADFSHSHLALDQTPTRIALRERHPLCALAIAVADRDLTRPVPAAKNSE